MKLKLTIGSLLILASFFYSCKKEKYEELGLRNLDNFGDNPGNLDMYYFEPDNPNSGMPLVVVMHGCSQDAAEIAELTEWNDLADRYGFYVLYPQQKTINNATKCFNWFKEDDQEKGNGESKSIWSMVNKMQSLKSLNSSVYVTGVSAGAAMSMVMLSCYPEVFSAGAILSGGPYKAAENALESTRSMSGEISKSPTAWGDLVRNQNPIYNFEYPRLLVFHGIDDGVVDVNNAKEIVKQWSDVLGIDHNIYTENKVATDVQQFIYGDSSLDTLLVYYEIEDLGHAISTDPGTGAKQGGGTETFAKDKDFFSTYWTAHFFGLVD